MPVDKQRKAWYNEGAMLNFDTTKTNLFLTADLHLGHRNIIKYQNRPFKNVRDMNRELSLLWNERINNDSVVLYLGDFTLNDYAAFQQYTKSLNGTIYIVPGNHDWRWIRDFKNSQRIRLLSPLAQVKVNENDLILCHYPLRQWNKRHYGSFHAFGHCHGSISGIGRSMDVGVDANNYKPISWKVFYSTLEKENM